MNETVKATLAGLPKEFIDWLNSLRNRNPLDGSDSGKNTNLVFVAIGRNLVIDTILEAREEAIHPKPKQPVDIRGTDVIMSPVKEP